MAGIDAFVLADDPTERRRVEEVAGRLDVAVRIVERTSAVRMFEEADAPVLVLDERESTSPGLFDLVRARPGAIALVVDGRAEGRHLAGLVADFATPPDVTGRPNFVVAPDLPADLEARAPSRPGNPLRVLVSFGGEDPAGLTEPTARILAAMSGSLVLSVDVLRGPLMQRLTLPPGVGSPGPTDNLPRLMRNYDLVVASFGMTALEARALGLSVVTVNPSRYHRRMARRAGLVCAGLGRPSRRRLCRAVANAKRQSATASAPGSPTLFDVVSGADPRRSTGCPVCKSKENRYHYRSGYRSYAACVECGTWYMENLGHARMSYDEDYFFSSYARQYGRTYLDDFDHIKGLAGPRLDAVEEVLAPRPARPRLLDFGCAYGPFLAAAAERGFDVLGVDVSPGAVAHVREKLGLPAALGDILSLGELDVRGPFDVITAWFVLEHFSNLGEILARLAGLLKPGGVLALATPNGAGISARNSRDRFLENSPQDHYTIWTPAHTGPLLARYGLSLKKTRITGHHPERFRTAGIIPRSILALASRRLGLGDTFEAYARRQET